MTITFVLPLEVVLVVPLPLSQYEVVVVTGLGTLTTTTLVTPLEVVLVVPLLPSQ